MAWSKSTKQRHAAVRRKLAEKKIRETLPPVVEMRKCQKGV